MKQPTLTLREEFDDLKWRLSRAESRIEKLRKLTEADFQKWCDEIDRIARAGHNFTCDCTISTGRECWREFYETGYSAESALLEDLSNE